MRKKYSKRPFTLFEIMIVMTLVATALGVLTLQISKALKGERFERGVDQVIVKLALAQELMLDFHTDVRLTLFQKEGEDDFTCTLEIARPLPEYLEKSINRYCTIKGVEQIVLDDPLHKSVDLYFDGTLGVTPKGKLNLLAHDKKETIILNGYPAQIKRGGDNGPIQNDQASYPKESISAA